MRSRAALHDAHVAAWFGLICGRIRKLSRLVDGCWQWTGAVNAREGRESPRAIPVMALPNNGTKGVSVRRLAARIAGLRLTPDQVVVPTCDCRLCVNPDHMRAITRRQMAREAVAAGRIRTGPTISARHIAAARRNPHVKLTIDKVREMRARYAAGTNAAALGREYGISPQHAHRVCTGQWWRDGNPFGGLIV